MMRTLLLAAARSGRTRRVVERLRPTRAMVNRFVPGTATSDALAVTGELIRSGRAVTLDYLGEDTLDRSQADATVEAYLALLGGLSYGALAEVSVKLSAVGQALPGDGEEIALANARRICAAAADVGTTVTLDMESHTTTDSTLRILHKLRTEFPWVGAVVQAALHRTEADCRELAAAGSRVRLCKGAYKEPATVAYQKKDEIDAAYLRCLDILMAGSGYPMVASHDPAIIAAAQRMAGQYRRSADTWEHQMLYGIRVPEQERLAAAGYTMRVYVPYGGEYYGYFMRRLAERPANLTFFLRALVSRS
ncbi:MAG: proline dehydrogenase [Hamadaea sp.]|uniref:proline dehydrogenase family protein n=1 Tax=Hamadaea sp. TaxID=2024425 RepID=UPI001810A44C|nr:proline dehydrogenase family protein [Hamadaea sp.]NUR73701.1 proline dehydrogenase [Hamadaea sp.]NUT22552.1 proline dehydrogenase [Hamadaea sp.]